MSPMTVVAIFCILTLLYFLFVGINAYSEIHNHKDFFLLGKKMQHTQFSGSFAASSTSLATALIFFVTLGAFYGLPILLAPLSYVIGAFVLAVFIKEKSISDTIKVGTSLFEFFTRATQQRQISFLVCVVPAFGVLSVLLIEFYVGIAIFSIFAAPNTVNVQLALGFLSVIVMLYTAIGGFPAVVRTDIVQITLIWLGAIVLLGICLYVFFFIDPSPTGTTKVNWTPHPLFGAGFFILPVAITANVLVVNAFIQFTQLRTWQMIAASTNIREVQIGLIRGAILTGTIWSLFAFIGILSNPILGLDTSTIDGFMRSMADSQYEIIAYVALPFFFIACLSALVSTADSALLPLAQFICEYIKVKNENVLSPRIWIGVLIVLVNVLYFVVFHVLKYDFLQLLFTIYGIVIAIGPLVLVAIFRPNLMKDTTFQYVGVISVFSGAFATIIVSYIASQDNVPFGAPLGFVISAVIVLLGVMAKNKVFSQP